MLNSIKISLCALVLTVSLAGSPMESLRTAWADCPVGDLNRDCKVDWEDLLVFAGQWLDTDSSREGLVAHWKLDGNADDPVGGNHGTVCGSTEWTIGKIDGALDFGGGVGDYVSIPDDDSLDLTNNFSISAWFKPDAAGLFLLICKGNVPAYSDGGAYTILCLPGGDMLAFYVRGSNGESRYASTSVPLPLNEWTHVVGTFSDGNIKVYKDGDPPASNTLETEEINSNTEPLGIGADGDGDMAFSGTIDDVRIYGRVLSEGEVQEIVNLGIPEPNCADLDRDGNVNLSDFTQLAENWQKEGNPLVINEFMASNSNGSDINDLQGDHDDWVEIYNNRSVTIDIGGMYLTDDLSRPTRWPIPDNDPCATTISPRGYLLIWADGETGEGTLHANFAVKNGEVIGLYDADENLIDSISINDQVSDVSYGRYPDAGDTWRFMGFPTPGSQNNGGYLGQVADTEFSHNRGFYDEDFNVTITCDTPGAAIRYTTDGSAPTETHGDPYVAAITIEGTTCLRAAAFKAGYLSSNVDTHTYIFLADVINQPANPPGFPSTWDGKTADYDMDPAVISRYTYAELTNSLLSLPSISIVTDMDNLFDNSIGIYENPSGEGEEWERPASAEWIDHSGGPEFQVNCGLRMQGGAARTFAIKKPFRLLFKTIYGASKLEFPMFEESGNAADSFDTITLRANSQGPNYLGAKTQITDDNGRHTLLDMGTPQSHGTSVHLYVNGLYWGIYNPVERPQASFCVNYFGGEKEEWDAHNGNEAIDGTRDTWNAMIAQVQAGLADNAAYQKIQGNNPDGTPNPDFPVYLDMPNYIDYMLCNFYIGTGDWAGNENQGNRNYYCARRRIDDSTGFKWFIWDAERSLQYTNNTSVSYGPAEPYTELKNNDEFRLLFADHAHRHMFNDGALTAGASRPRFIALMDMVRAAIIAEEARWDLTNVTMWEDNTSNRIDNFFPSRTNTVLGYLKNAGLYPNLAAPVFSPHGGWDLTAFDITVSAPGTIYYTTDGNDPRLPGGSNNPDAISYGPAIHLEASTRLKARTKSGSTWSALNEATFAIGPVADNLRITEMMYHPQDTNNPDDPNAEFIELKNIGLETTINLSLVRFTEGINFTFPSLELTAGEYVLLVKDQALFTSRYTDVPPGVDILGPYEGRLANGGERIRLEDAIGRTILDFEYSDGWRPITDGDGFSLTIIDPTNSDPNSWGEKDSWRASDYVGGSPGEDTDILPNPGAVVINEVMAHSHLAPDWVELHNTTGASINIGGWFLSDNDANLMKYKIEDGMTIAPNSYLVFYEDVHFGDGSNPDIPFALSENGEEVCLSSADGNELTGYREVEDFGASETGVSFGRYFKSSTGNFNFVAMDSNTPGWDNAPPKVGPIVISEIMYHPDWPDDGSYNNDEYEYIELHNITDADVNLYDEEGIPWKFTDGIDFTFPDGPDEVTIPADGYLLVVKNPAAFMWRVQAELYPSVPLPPERILGPYDGRLNNAGERLEISMPGDVDEGVRQYIRIDRVNYSDGSHPEDCPGGVDHWPTEADGGGKSLARKVLTDYGNDPDNWQAASPSPGSSNPP